MVWPILISVLVTPGPTLLSAWPSSAFAAARNTARNARTQCDIVLSFRPSQACDEYCSAVGGPKTTGTTVLWKSFTCQAPPQTTPSAYRRSGRAESGRQDRNPWDWC